MRRRSVLALSAATGRVGYVYFSGDQPAHWSISHTAASSPVLAARQTEKWISMFAPSVVVTEKIGSRSRKGEHTKYLIAAMADTAHDAGCQHRLVLRSQRYANKYDEADALANRFPILSAWVPKRPRLWEAEPRNMMLFEAIALAVSVIDEADF